MKLKINIVLLVLIVLSNKVHRTNALIDDVLDVIHITKEVVSGVLNTWKLVEQTSFGENIDIPLITTLTRDKHKKVLQRLRDISRKIELTEAQHANEAAWTIESLNRFMQTSTREELALHDMHQIINKISTRSKQMNNYAKHRERLENSTLIDFTQWAVSPNADSIHHLLERLSALFVGNPELRSKNNGVLYSIGEHLKDAKDQVCETKQSPQQFLFSLYSDITLAELKGYTMIQFSWMILRIYGQGNFTHESTLMREEFEQRADRTQHLVREVMRRAERIVWRCDPTQHIKGETYDEVTRLLQGYIENEVDMNPDQTCRENCGYYSVGKSHGCFKELYCSRQSRCTGQLYNCQYVDSDMWVCPASSKSIRRYEYIEYENGRVLGQKGSCARGTSKVDSWWRWLFWHCSYCFCLCDEQGSNSDRYFNLRETTSNIENDMVVTGIRFVKKNRIFHLQIQEGQLQSRGNINASSLEWKPVENYQIFDSNVRSGVDYHTLSWNNRAIDLDEITTDDPLYILTGVRFRIVGTHLNLEIRLTEFDFETGKLIEPQQTSFWKSNDNTDLSRERRTEIKLQSPDISTRTIVKSTPTSKHNQYIHFVNSDMDKDAAQSTVPFVDIQPVYSNPPVPLSGLGIYHKGRSQYGGFVAPKLITYDFAPHVRSPKYIKK